MSIPGERDGFATKVAIKAQSAAKVPVPGGGVVFEDDDVLRIDNSPAPDPQIKTTANVPTGTGAPFEQDESTVVSGIKPIVSAIAKATPRHLRRLLEANMNITPTTSAGPIGTNYLYRGFSLGGIKPMTWVWDTSQEAVRAFDVFMHTLELTSDAGDALMMNLAGQGGEFSDPPLTPLLTAVKLIHFDAYAHKDSLILDYLGGTTTEIFATSQSLKLEWGLIERDGNKVQPSYIGRARQTVTGTIRTRLYDDTASWLARIIQNNRSKISMRYEQQDGKLLTINLENVEFLGKGPSVVDDGTLDDFEITFRARRSGFGASGAATATEPYSIIVED